MQDEKFIEDFPDYLVARDGVVYSVYKHRVRKPSYTRNGAAKITLYRDGEAFTRSLALIVAKAHVYNDHDPDIFDTPIHLDNDLANNHADNLAWRPRWFAVKYQSQYWTPHFRHATTKVRDATTGEVYDSLIEPCQKLGVLYVDILNSCTKETTVFPTWKIFQFV